MEIRITFMLVKKVLVIILLAAYTFASSGASVDVHYCMGKFIGLDFNYYGKNDCSNCGMPTKTEKGCCHDKLIQVKIDKEQQVTYNNFSLFSNQTAICATYGAPDDPLPDSTVITYPSIHGPPSISHTSIYLFNCSFRI
jgi:hypothetical protein